MRAASEGAGESPLEGAKQRLGERDWARGVRLFEKAQAAEEPDAEAWALYGLGLNSLGLLEDAEKAYRKAIDMNPRLADAYANLGVMLIRDMDRPMEAKQMFLSALEIDPKHRARGDLKELRRLLERRRQEVNETPFPEHEREASWWETKGRPAKALQIYLDFLDIYPRSVVALNHAATLQLQMNKPDKALELLERAIQIKPDYVKAWVNLGSARVQMGDVEGAKKAFYEALDMDPKNAVARHSLKNMGVDKPPIPGNQVPPDPSSREVIKFPFDVRRVSGDGVPRMSGEVECCSCGRGFNLFGQYSIENPPMDMLRCRSCGKYYCEDCVEATEQDNHILKCSCGHSRTSQQGAGNFEPLAVYRRPEPYRQSSGEVQRQLLK